jgi:large subunit ribosomal protein L22
VTDLIKGLDVEKAEVQLKNLRKRSSLPVLQLLESAVSSAEHNYNMVKSNLYIESIIVNGGTVMKRWKPRAFGRAYPILKRSSHIILVLNERVAGKKVSKKIVKDKEIKNKVDGKNEKVKKDNKKTKFKVNNSKNNKPTKEGGVLKKIFRRKSA